MLETGIRPQIGPKQKSPTMVLAGKRAAWSRKHNLLQLARSNAITPGQKASATRALNGWLKSNPKP